MPECKPIKSGKLTKKFLMELEEGQYLISSIQHDIYNPLFSEAVFPVDKREGQWKRIVKLQVNNRLCEVFQSKKSFEEYNHKRFSNYFNKK